ncbi:MAG: alpha-glucan family phosphorylase [bacterium]|nr:alpha-glucan family phosphorylase [bacterium]
MAEQESKKRFLFEVSWEVCNKVGGIYTVIQSKLPEATKEFSENYILIGPLLDTNPGFIEETGIGLVNLKAKLKMAGITAKIGVWNVETKPRVILVHYKDGLDQNKLLFQLWEDFGIDSMSGGWDYMEPVLFSTTAAKAIEALNSLYSETDMIAQFHEWMTGAGLLYLKKKCPHIATIFTTHATVLGRSMAGNGVDIYKILSILNTDSEATRYNVSAKHSIETITAREADCFTTVSKITAIEAKHMLNQEVHTILPNGFPVKAISSYSENPEYFKKSRERLLEFSSQFLSKEIKGEETLIVSTSGRYEFHNKGIDLLLEALAELKRCPEQLSKNLLCYLFVTGGSPYTQHQIERHYGIATHQLWDPNNDPILNSCRKHNLLNSPDDRINIIFVPVYLNGQDGVLNMEYYEALSGCDLTVYPSFYEPWGYTGLESIAYSVPTLTTDAAGFGQWVNSIEGKYGAVKVLSVLEKEFASSMNELKNFLLYFSALKNEDREKMRGSVRAMALSAEWEVFFKNYLEAFNIALTNCEKRLIEKEKVIPGEVYKGADSPVPRFRQFSIKSSIPQNIERLRDLSYNLWWAWNPDAYELFSRLDPILYERMGNNPVAFLETVSPKRLEEASENEDYLHLYESVMKRFDKYCASKKPLLKSIEGISSERPVAYFSMEYGLHECMPLYAGGLGMLSGDHIKSASDLNIPLVAIGLLYKQGYFKQGISKEGNQKVEYFHNDFFRMPLSEVTKNRERMIIAIDFPGRIVHAQVWKVQVGRTPIYLLDTDIGENSLSDREITGKLYSGERHFRIEQEIVLGIGGIRLLEEMNISPSVYHINEGHSAFLVIERLINLMRYNNLELDTAKEVVKASTIFTTHTPVPAGIETFEPQLIENYFKHYVETNGLSWKEFWELGRKDVTEKAPYEMAVLALKNSSRRNGVSRLHGVVSQRMWHDLWKGLLLEEVPISYITNGVHAATWLTIEMKNLLSKYCGIELDEALMRKDIWEKVQEIPDEVLWQTHLAAKNKLFVHIRERIAENWTREGESPELLEEFLRNLSPNSLTLGFARRCATYKRSTLFLKDMNRIKRLILNKRHPIQFVVAGKAHPKDEMAFGLIKEIANLGKQPDLLGKIIFLEDYDIKLARRMVSGVDVWLNNSRRPLEACGTSGQKAGMNGIIHLSSLDGWWDEAFDGKNGWAIGGRREYKNAETQDLADSDSLYDILEEEIIPEYYARNEIGIPERWIKRMKDAIISVISEFNTHRMVRDYTEKMYIPVAKRYFSLMAEGFKKVQEIADWKRSITARFSSVHINSITIDRGEKLNVGDEITLRLEINRGRVSKEELSAQIAVIEDKKEEVIGYTGPPKGLYTEDIQYIPMDLDAEDDTTIKYKGRYKATKSGKFNYGIRITPFHPDVDDTADLGLVYWG